MRLALLGLAVLAPPVLAPPVLAQARWAEAPVISGRLSFDGKSTLGDFTGITDSIRGQMTGGSLSEVRGWVEAPVRTLKTGNNRRDRDLVKTMEADIFPTIRFVLDGVEAQGTEGDSTAVWLSGRFFIHGVTRSERFTAVVRRTASGARVTADLPMNLKDYQVTNLTRLLVLKMNPDIVVHIEVTFSKLYSLILPSLETTILRVTPPFTRTCVVLDAPSPIPSGPNTAVWGGLCRVTPATLGPGCSETSTVSGSAALRTARMVIESGVILRMASRCWVLAAVQACR